MMSNKKEVTCLSLLMLAIFILMMKTTAANAWELIHKKDMQHNQQFEIDIQYANGFSTLNNKTKHLIKQIKRQFLQDIQANKSIPKSAPGKNTLVVRYERAYMEASQKRCGFNPQYCIPKRLSLIYTVSENLKGYAHPKTTIYTLNFLEGQFTDLNKTFRIKADNIKQIQNYIISQLNAEKHADLPWFKKNVNAQYILNSPWVLMKNGFILIFPQGTLKPAYLGPTKIEIPESVLVHRG